MKHLCVPISVCVGGSRSDGDRRRLLSWSACTSWGLVRSGPWWLHRVLLAPSADSVGCCCPLALQGVLADALCFESWTCVCPCTAMDDLDLTVKCLGCLKAKM